VTEIVLLTKAVVAIAMVVKIPIAPAISNSNFKFQAMGKFLNFSIAFSF